jgi:hypothetical protein
VLNECAGDREKDSDGLGLELPLARGLYYSWFRRRSLIEVSGAGCGWVGGIDGDGAWREKCMNMVRLKGLLRTDVGGLGLVRSRGFGMGCRKVEVHICLAAVERFFG